MLGEQGPGGANSLSLRLTGDRILPSDFSLLLNSPRECEETWWEIDISICKIYKSQVELARWQPGAQSLGGCPTPSPQGGVGLLSPHGFLTAVMKMPLKTHTWVFSLLHYFLTPSLLSSSQPGQPALYKGCRFSFPQLSAQQETGLVTQNPCPSCVLRQSNSSFPSDPSTGPDHFPVQPSPQLL